MLKIKIAHKLYIPIIFLSVIMAFFAYNMYNISSFINKELKKASNKELQLANDAKFIKNSLITMKTILIKNILNKNKKDLNAKLKLLKLKYIKVIKVLNKMKKNPYFQAPSRKVILRKLEARIKGYYAILKDMPQEYNDSFEDGTYSMLSLISVSSKMNAELDKLQNATKEILNQKIYTIVRDKVEFYILIMALSLIIIFITIYSLNKEILYSIIELKKLIHLLLSFVQNKISTIGKINRRNIPHDEIGETIQEAAQTVLHIKKIIKQDRKLRQEIEDTQKEIVFTMGAIGESRSKETGNHVKRVAEYSYILAKAYGLDEKEAQLLKEASPMHDIGKVAIPDAILHKYGYLTDKERKIMNTHAKLGYNMLKHSKRPLLQAAAIIAYQHHEKWDGSGYPRKLKGEEIHIFGRITALADVFDALGSDRCYKKAWSDEKIFALLKEEKGKHFEPKLVDLFFANLNDFLKIRDKFNDNYCF